MPSDFAREKEFEAQIKEYETLRAEIGFRLAAQSQLTNISLLLIGGVTAISPFLFSLNAGTLKLIIPPIYFIIMLFVITLLFTSLALAFIGHQVELGRIGIYCNKFIRPRIGELLEEGTVNFILRWDHWHTEQGVPPDTLNFCIVSIFMFSQLGIMVIPALVTLSVGISTYISDLPTLSGDIGKWVALILLIFDVAYFFSLIPCSWSALRSFTEIG